MLPHPYFDNVGLGFELQLVVFAHTLRHFRPVVLLHAHLTGLVLYTSNFFEHHFAPLVRSGQLHSADLEWSRTRRASLWPRDLYVATFSPLLSPSLTLLLRTFSGFAPGLGACGITSTFDSPIVAVSHLLFDTYPGATLNPNDNPISGRKIMATYNRKRIIVTVADRCIGCEMWDIDFSPASFGKIADVDVGRLNGVQVSVLLCAL